MNDNINETKPYKGNKQKTYFAKQNKKVTVSLTIIQDLCVFLIFSFLTCTTGNIAKHRNNRSMFALCAFIAYKLGFCSLFCFEKYNIQL